MELKDKNGLTEKEYLSSYIDKDYRRPSVTATVAIMVRGNPLKVLMIKRGGHPYIGRYALPGGFSNEGETIEETAKRELEEETGLKDIPLEFVKIMTTPKRDPRTWVDDCVFLALLDEERYVRANDDADEAEYFELGYEWAESNVNLVLKGSKDTFRATLSTTSRKGIREEIIDFKQTYSELAFDHAEEIAYSLVNLEYIKKSK